MDSQNPRPGAAERTERHLAAVAELADAALHLALDAARKALRHAAAEAAAEAAGLPPPSLPRPTGPDPADAFCRMSREVCRLIILEARLAGQWRHAGRDRRRGRSVGPLRARVRRILHEAVVIEPDGPDDETMLETIEEALHDDQVEEMMADDAPIGDVLALICRDFDLKVDDDRLPDEALRAARTRPRPSLAEQGPDPP